MNSYARLLSEVYSSSHLAERSHTALPDELTLQSLWFAGQFGRDFTTTEGQAVRIIQFGHWNRAAGPDFLNTSVEIDGEIFNGPLELDTRTLDWEHHGHAENPSFDSTVLHVVFEDSPKTYYTRSHSGKAIPRIIIPADRTARALTNPRFATNLAHIGRCSQPLKSMPEEQVLSLMEQAARHRAQTKAAQLKISIDAQGWNETLWQAFARVLGYRKNQLPFTLLSQRLPVRLLQQHKEDTEALLFGAAGFLRSDISESAPENSREYLRNLWERWWRLRPDYEAHGSREIQWTLSGMRPSNHPQRRIGALSSIISQWRSISQAVRHAPIKELEETLSSLAHSFWSHHHTLKSNLSEKPIAIFGATRAKDFIVNIVLPLRLSENPNTWDDFMGIPASNSNEKLEKALVRLFGSNPLADSFVKKAWQQQAILQIYNDFCLNDSSECKDCAFPEQLAQWQSHK